MLVNCPRCGFSQPKDQYCAQCGVDMQAYKPKEKPLLSRLFSSTAVQVGVLILAAALAAQYILRNEQPQKWVQKISPFQGVSRSEKNNTRSGNLSANPANSNQYSDEESLDTSSESYARERADGRGGKNEIAQTKSWAGANGTTNGTENNLARNSGGSFNNANQNNLAANTPPNPGAAQDLSSLGFQVTYAEISSDMLTKWVADSSAIGLYQVLPEYSAGILYDFRKRGETYHQLLKNSDLKVNVGSANSSISGVMADDGVQFIGLVSTVEYRSNENDSILGNINVTRTSQQVVESYPAEFTLPKGAAFFIVGAVKRDSFAADRAKLNMPPFQIFKSPDFMTRKTEFVIILEHDYK